jgi:putative N-acetylmannosamine-6-phosphate epimerase
MDKKAVLHHIRGGLVVSCQALEHEPLHSPSIMARMGIAAKEGGAVAIRANSGVDIRAIKEATGLPVIGLVKRFYPDCGVFITPTMEEVKEAVAAGAEIIAIDATNRPRPDGLTTEEHILAVKEAFPHVLVMADISTLEEGIHAAKYGADIVGSTLSGYTPYTRNLNKPDYTLLAQLVQRLSIPVIAEGNIRTPEEAVKCYELGVWSVVVGSAITRPQEITRWFVQRIERGK